jgi:glycosyltransferase involved in cell wall biosynthesis
MKESPARIALILPTLNEIDGMKAVLPKIDRSLFHEIIVVDGRSTDGTQEYCKEQGLTVLTQPNKWLPDAEEWAFKNSTSDALIIFTPDGNSVPELLPEMCRLIRDGWDIVVASRYCKGAKSYDDDVVTAFGNWMFTKMVNILFRVKLTDVLVGYRAYTRDAIERMHLVGMSEETWLRRHCLYLNGWESGASARAARLRLKLLEIPGDEPKRIGGVRKLKVVRNGIATLVQFLHDWLFFRGPK